MSKKRTETKVKITTTTKHELRLSREDVLGLLKKSGYKLPANGVEISFEVPSGGDYSGIEVPLENLGDDNPPLVVRWEETR